MIPLRIYRPSAPARDRKALPSVGGALGSPTNLTSPFMLAFTTPLSRALSACAILISDSLRSSSSSFRFSFCSLLAFSSSLLVYSVSSDKRSLPELLSEPSPSGLGAVEGVVPSEDVSVSAAGGSAAASELSLPAPVFSFSPLPLPPDSPLSPEPLPPLPESPLPVLPPSVLPEPLLPLPESSVLPEPLLPLPESSVLPEPLLPLPESSVPPVPGFSSSSPPPSGSGSGSGSVSFSALRIS